MKALNTKDNPGYGGNFYKDAEGYFHELEEGEQPPAAPAPVEVLAAPVPTPVAKTTTAPKE